MARLLGSTKAGPSSCVIVAGKAGYGKRTLMRRVAENARVRGAFPGGVRWVREGEPPRHALVVAEDVKEEGELRRLAAQAGTARVFLTENLGLSPPYARRIEVGPLEADEARALLTAEVPGLEGGYRSEELDGLVDELYRWPLALTLANAELRCLAQQTDAARALQLMRKAVARHGVTAFDPRGVADADSVCRRMTRRLERLGPEEREALTALARGRNEAVDDPDVVRVLADQGLIETADREGPTVDPAVRDFLIAEGWIAAPSARPAVSDLPISSSDSLEKPPQEVLTAEQALRDTSIPQDEAGAKQLVKQLQKMQFFGPARQYLALACAGKFQKVRWFGQQHAVCTYKDTELAADARLDLARQILEEVDPPGQSQDSETLGIAGAIGKRKWEVDGRRENLEQCFAYYLRGYEIERKKTDRYAGINAAYVLDLLAKAGQVLPGKDSESSEARLRKAREIREEIREALAKALNPAAPDSGGWNWWNLATMAEACFGLRRYEEARYWIREGMSRQPLPWEFETFARQLANIACLQEAECGEPDPQVTATLRVLLGEHDRAIPGLRAGKMGLALSGGGFRAALFHIGVLARLAEMNVLRHVEVLSCVSGGSIIGAFYYLRVKQMLESKADEEIGRDDYVAVVQGIEREFLRGVQRDLRNRLFAEFGTAWRSILKREYSQTFRLGQLFERELYGLKEAVEMRSLRIQPRGAEPGFQPKLHNWKRAAKAPILVLNATTLNTGHNWQFTATWMGEPLTGINPEIDVNARLRRMYYWQSEKYADMRLGHAVVASAAVPALFDPLTFETLYREQVVSLADGGVNDNQGTSALLGEDCNILLISDASGQLTTEERPSSDRLGVLWRANQVLQERLRGVAHRDASARRRSGLVRAFLFLHLTKDLDGADVAWIGKQPPAEPPDVAAAGRDPVRTNYNILRAVQHGLSRLRTDLDAFGDDEAYALMLSGYNMCGHEFRSCVTQYSLPQPECRAEWDFRRMAPIMADTGVDRAEELVKSLAVGQNVFGKVFRLNPGLKATLVISGVVGLLAGAADAVLLCVRYAVAREVALGLAAIAILLVWRARHIGRTWSQMLIAFLLGGGGALAFKMYLKWLAPWYLEWGRRAISRQSTQGIRWMQLVSGAAAALMVVVLVVLLKWT